MCYLETWSLCGQYFILRDANFDIQLPKAIQLDGVDLASGVFEVMAEAHILFVCSDNSQQILYNQNSQEHTYEWLRFSEWF